MRWRRRGGPPLANDALVGRRPRPVDATNVHVLDLDAPVRGQVLGLVVVAGQEEILLRVVDLDAAAQRLNEGKSVSPGQNSTSICARDDIYKININVAHGSARG